ncbi:ATP-dependent DNA helicase recG domain protein [Mycobacterium xenopi 4042]|uniref:ATP-dependent DNA helicase recG domain protein n=1 Tax=Mycobacterium xenopi 4042 TaxID=1299334 RepID=X8E612_MYCXE|nr:ATP-dependent DNA helicase recG domain protein [Mycobacterium xenopi 4042]
MVALTDRLDYVLGAKSADPLDEAFGIRTVQDLLRHYPRTYVEGAAVRGVGDERRRRASTSRSSTPSPARCRAR